MGLMLPLLPGRWRLVEGKILRLEFCTVEEKTESKNRAIVRTEKTSEICSRTANPAPRGMSVFYIYIEI